MNPMCWECMDEGLVIRHDPYRGKVAVTCPRCEDRRIIREEKERRRKADRALDDFERAAREHNRKEA